MVHVLAPRPSQAFIPVFYNVDASVGRNGANSSFDDIMLVQFFLRLVGRGTNPGSKLASLAGVPVTGSINPQTITGIETLQAASRVPTDGRVSVANGYRHGAGFFTIVTLNFNVKERFKAQWPNVEEMPDCPRHLNLACRHALVGSTG